MHSALPGLAGQRAVLRPSWFMQNFTGQHAHALSIAEHGSILTATGSGRARFIDAGDIAAVAFRALTGERAPGTDLVLTGPEALSYDDIAAIMTEVTAPGRRRDHGHALPGTQPFGQPRAGNNSYRAKAPDQQIPAQALKDRLTGAGMSDAMAQATGQTLWSPRTRAWITASRAPRSPPLRPASAGGAWRSSAGRPGLTTATATSTTRSCR